MSRIGKRILTIPEGVNVIIDNDMVIVKGSKGELSFKLSKGITVNQIEGTLTVERSSDIKTLKQLHGTTNAILANMIKGVSEGFEKGIEILGVGYRFLVKGDQIVVSAGYSHPVELTIPKGLTVDSINNTEILVKGIDKVLVGEFSANIRKVREPEPYKGKGIRYKGEQVRRKEGKKAS
jgi:large subunit ribosomal protein L6